MKTWSLCPFFDELDVLEIRLATLDEVVDVHVIAESTVTYSGEPKPLLFQDNMDRFKPWLHKIRHVVVDDAPEGDTWVDPSAPLQPSPDSHRWKRENHQRDALIRGCDDMEDDDLVYLSDCDEIVTPSCFDRAPDWLKSMIAPRPVLPMHVLYLNWRWNHALPVIARFVRGANLKMMGPEAIRLVEGEGIGGGLDLTNGWHFSYLGGIEAIKRKLKSAAHAELDQPPYNDDDWLQHCLDTGTDIFDRPEKSLHPAPLTTLPPYVQQNLQRFAHLIR